MAKQDGVIKIKGKLDDKVYVRGSNGLDYVRAATKAGTKRGEIAMREQYNRTGFFNKLASQLTRLLGSYFGPMKSSNFYRRVHKLFRQEPLDNRCLLLMQLKGMDLHPRHTLGKMGATTVTINIEEEKLVAILRTGTHPYGRYKANSYFHELSLISWNAAEDFPAIQQQRSDWIAIHGKMPSFKFEFPITGARHWMLCQRQSTGINNKELQYMATQGVTIIDVGSFDKDELEFIDKQLQERKAILLDENRRKERPVEPPRVKPMEE